MSPHSTKPQHRQQCNAYKPYTSMILKFVSLLADTKSKYKNQTKKNKNSQKVSNIYFTQCREHKTTKYYVQALIFSKLQAKIQIASYRSHRNGELSISLPEESIVATKEKTTFLQHYSETTNPV